MLTNGQVHLRNILANDYNNGTLRNVCNKFANLRHLHHKVDKWKTWWSE